MYIITRETALTGECLEKVRQLRPMVHGCALMVKAVTESDVTCTLRRLTFN